jgi:hypothetical protein
MLPNLTTGRILGKLQANLRTKASSLFTALPAEVAVPSTRQKQFILQTLDIHQQPNYIKQLDLEKSFHLYSFDLPYPSTNTSPS